MVVFNPSFYEAALFCTTKFKSVSFFADEEKAGANIMRLIQDKHYNKMKPTVHIGLSNAKCQDRTPLLFKSKLLHEITQSQLNLQRNCTGNLKSLDPMYSNNGEGGTSTYTNNSSQSSNGRLDSDVVTKSNAKQKNKEADQQILL
ncbi:hypothetical protein QL285_008172 [Trifolium repens]|jgi:hypothetical protein|nr:hypothetical protein QL285_008172 [Trifolium repens]